MLIVFSLFFGHASASVKFVPIVSLCSENIQLCAAPSLNSDTAFSQDNCAGSKSNCANRLMTSCADAARSTQCASGMFGLLILNQPPMVLKHIDSTPLNYNVSIYHYLSPGITPRPPKTVV